MCKVLKKYVMSIRKKFLKEQNKLWRWTEAQWNNSLAEFNGRFEQEKERIGEYKDKTIVLVQYEDQKEKRIKKNEQSLRDL